MNEYDLLVVGSGIAGLTAALCAAQRGLKVCVLTKDPQIHHTNTFYAQGGIVATGIEDSPELLTRDILLAGSEMNYEPAVQLLATEAPSLAIEYLSKKIGIPFVRNADGDFDRTKEAAHSTRRILHVTDHTGRAIQEGLSAYVQKMEGVTILPDMTTIDIITSSHNSVSFQDRYRKNRALGVYVLNNVTGNVEPIFAATTILATGGVGNLYLHTSNPPSATGDGIAMAYRVGVEILNAEFVQFHPTVLFHRDIGRFLITEAMRGEGARLINRDGEYFMDRYAPGLKELAPRDEVARAIYSEIESDNSAFVLLDATQIKGINLEERFPDIFSTCMKAGIDIRKDPVPVVPAAHYFCGGIKVDINGATSLDGLYAVGETACTGVHGANRLASVSLLEGFYFAVRAVAKIAEDSYGLDQDRISNIPEWVSPEKAFEFDPVLIHSDLLSIRHTMWNYAGIIRTKSRLERAIADLGYMQHRVDKFYREARVTREIIELRNATVASFLIARAAYANGTSIGCHYLRS
ncbi:MAG: L-aspartate oxidase [Spirochaetales bacterium]|nr:L-aspartate oxidase [Spirochaetales bacterium]